MERSDPDGDFAHGPLVPEVLNWFRDNTLRPHWIRVRADLVEVETHDERYYAKPWDDEAKAFFLLVL
jgi:hypothetical protein